MWFFRLNRARSCHFYADISCSLHRGFKRARTAKCQISDANSSVQIPKTQFFENFRPRHSLCRVKFISVTRVATIIGGAIRFSLKRFRILNESRVRNLENQQNPDLTRLLEYRRVNFAQKPRRNAATLNLPVCRCSCSLS